MNDGRLLFDEQAQARRRLTLFAAIAGFVALACLGIGQSMQLRFLDLWYLIRGDREPSPQVVIVAIDGRSLNREDSAGRGLAIRRYLASLGRWIARSKDWRR